MKKLIIAALATVMGAASLASPASAQGFSAGASAASSAVASPIEQVQRRYYHGDRRYYRHRGHYRDRHYYRRGRGDAVAAGVAGLAVGALVGSALTANSQPYYAPAPAPVYAGNDWHAYCASKYRSYDVRTGTFMGYDGIRRPCR